MGDCAATRSEIIVRSVLILIRASLVALTRRLVMIRPRLILIARILVALTSRLVTISHRKNADQVGHTIRNAFSATDRTARNFGCLPACRTSRDLRHRQRLAGARRRSCHGAVDFVSP